MVRTLGLSLNCQASASEWLQKGWCKRTTPSLGSTSPCNAKGTSPNFWGGFNRRLLAGPFARPRSRPATCCNLWLQSGAKGSHKHSALPSASLAHHPSNLTDSQTPKKIGTITMSPSPSSVGMGQKLHHQDMDRRFQSMCPLTRVPCWEHMAVAQKSGTKMAPW